MRDRWIWLVEAVLFFYPASFRHEYRAQILADVCQRGRPWRAAADVVLAALELHCEAASRTFRRAWRGLSSARELTSIAWATIAVAVAANLVVAILVQNVLLRGLPFPDSQRLLFVQETSDGRSLSYPDAQTLAARIGTYAQLALSASDSRTLFGHGAPVTLGGRLVTTGYFDVLGIRPELGRFFGTGDRDAARVVISGELWRRRFGASREIIGRTVRLDDRSYTVVGIAPAAFRDVTPFGLETPSYWLAIDRSPQATSPGNFDYNAVVRVRPPRDVRSASRDIATTLSAMLQARRHLRHWDVAVSSVRDTIAAPVKPLLLALYALVTAVLLVACANVAILQLARATAASDDAATCVALGATRSRMVVQALVESAIVSVTGGAAGLIAAWSILRAIAPSVATVLPLSQNLAIGGWAAPYVLVLMAATTLSGSLLPALTYRGGAIARALATARSSERHGHRALRAALIVVEIAAATALVTSAALLLQSFVRLTTANAGFDPANLYAVELPNPPRARYATDAAQLAFIDALAAHVRAIPGVEAMAPSLQLPYACCDATSFRIPGRMAQRERVLYNAVAPQYFRVLGIPLVEGRTFRPSDGGGASCVVVVSREFARRYFGGARATGHVVEPGLSGLERCTIAGVVGDVRSEFGKPAAPMLYFPLRADPEIQSSAVRTNGRVDDLAAAIGKAVAAVDPAIAAPQLVSYDELIAWHARGARLAVALFSALATVAVILALSGIYAAMAFTVRNRSYEFGIRKALGARDADVLRVALRAASGQIVAGIAAGLVLAAAMARVLDFLLYETSPFDPVCFTLAALLFGGCALLAATIPALRCTRVDPATILVR